MGKSIGRSASLLLLVLVGVNSRAEYRAFELKISKKEDPTQFRLVISTLDPFQYAGYYIVREDELVQYTRTWMCRGRTSELPICPDPNPPQESNGSEEPNRAPAAEPPKTQ